ncbi:unnamed protein product [Pleuronectes platessa]|uniref:Uncharacterized protein n=1 Tax=Pleuronectes platessa TaxID=8262 RepID=A0A9N7YL11_PLEPL|nr:unnamed protein product [Pleuronectes platessa]
MAVFVPGACALEAARMQLQVILQPSGTKEPTAIQQRCKLLPRHDAPGQQSPTVSIDHVRVACRCAKAPVCSEVFGVPARILLPEIAPPASAACIHKDWDEVDSGGH